MVIIFSNKHPDIWFMLNLDRPSLLNHVGTTFTQFNFKLELGKKSG